MPTSGKLPDLSTLVKVHPPYVHRNLIKDTGHSPSSSIPLIGNENLGRTVTLSVDLAVKMLHLGVVLPNTPSEATVSGILRILLKTMSALLGATSALDLTDSVGTSCLISRLVLNNTCTPVPLKNVI